MGGGWRARLVSSPGQTLLETGIGEPPRIRDGLRILWASLRRVPLGGLRVVHGNFGDVAVGRTRNGYVQPVRHTADGAVIIPYVVDPADGSVMIGMVRIRRGLVAGCESVLEVPRGGSEPGESVGAAARRELVEETGVDPALSSRLVELPGDPVSVDSAFQATDPSRGRGIRMFALPLLPSDIVLSGSGSHRTGRLRPGLMTGVPDAEEGIDPEGLLFLPLERAVLQGDNLTRGAAGALWGHLARTAGLSPRPAAALA